MFIPFYTGRVIDILGSNYQQNDFLSALLFMGLYSLGGYECSPTFLLCLVSTQYLTELLSDQVCECRLQGGSPNLCHPLLHLQNQGEAVWCFEQTGSWIL